MRQIMMPLDPKTASKHVAAMAATLTPAQQQLFYFEYSQHEKKYNTALAWAIATGWWCGGHKFYLGQWVQGIIHIVLALSVVLWVIPIILTIVDIVNLHKTIDQMNDTLADEICQRIRLIAPSV
jgi:TM2 domain-containing membrane protein YozV